MAVAVVTPFMFGALGDGAYDDGAALNNMFAYAASNACIVDATGSFRTSVPIIVGHATGPSQPATKDYRGVFRVTATAPMGIVVKLRNLQYCSWDGKIEAIGPGGASFSARTCDVGVAVENCSRMRLGGVVAQNFRHSGFQTSLDGVGGSTGMVIGNLRAQLCGSGSTIAGRSLTANWSGPVSTGGSGSAGQRTTISVDVTPPSYVFDYGTIGQQPVYVRISGKIYRVFAFDAALGTLDLAPWLEPSDIAAGSGPLEYIFGAGVVFNGADNNCLVVSQLDVADCAVGFRMGSLYGATVSMVVAQACAVGLWLGTNPGNSCIGYNIGYLYCESNQLDIVYMGGGVNWGTIQTTNEGFKWAKTLAFNGARTGAGTIGQPKGTFSQLSVGYLGQYLAFEKSPSPFGFSIVEGALNSPGPARPLVFSGDSVSFTLPALSADLRQNFGYDSKQITFIGTGPNKAPTGTITMNAPAGKTINGGASAAFSGFSGPATFVMQFNFTTLDWTVHLTSGRECITSIASVPNFIGQTAVVAGVGYLATGTAATSDWKQIT